MTMTGWNEKDKKHDTAATFGGTGHRLAKIAKNTAIIGLMAAMATACSTGGSTDSKSAGDTKGATETKAPEKNKEPITLNFYSTSGDYDSAAFMKMFGDKIQAKFPYITVKHIDRVAGVSVENLITAGQTLDIMYLSIGQTNELTNVKLEYDISNLIKANKFDTSRLEPTAVELQKLVANGGMYGLPVFNNTITTYYNKDLFDKFGVGYPKDGNTWDDIYDLTKKVARTDGGIQYQGFTLSMSHNMLVNQYSIPYTDKDNKVLFNTDPFKKLFETWTKFYHLPGNEVTDKTVNYTTQVNSFDKERTTAMFLGLANLGPARFKDLFNWDVVSFPEFKDKPGVGPQAYPSYFYITNQSKYKEQAFDVIAYLTSDEFQSHITRNGMFTALANRDVMKDFGKDVPYLAKKNYNSFLPKKFAPPAMPSKYVAIGAKHLTTAFNAVSLKQKDINTAMREAEEAANKEIQTQLSK